MNCVVPFVKIFDCAARQSYSRIPHIRAHIRSRRLGITSTRDRSCPSAASNPCATRPTRRSSSTYTGSPYDLLQDGDYLRKSSDREESNEAFYSQDTESADEDTRTVFDVANASLNSYDLFHQALTEGHPQKVLFALNDTVHGSTFIQTADDTTFTQALCTLDPAYFIEPYIQLYRNFDPVLHTDEVKYRQCRSLEDRWNKHVGALDNIIVKRREAGHALTLDAYRQLLKNAGAMGEELLAIDIFEKLMPEEGVEPDLECFNYYMQARVWSGWYEARFRQKTRVILSNLQSRLHPDQTIGKTRLRRWDFRPARPSPSTPDWIRKVVLNMFQDLNSRGFNGNEETYVNLMLAMSQAGDLSGVKSVLKSVWNINVDLLAKYDEEEIESPTYYDEGSPLRPTQLLLFTIAYTFANNNTMSLAYQLLDYVSRNYNVPVPEFIWSRLYEMTFVLARSRRERGTNAAYAEKWGYLQGQLEENSLPKFFNLITDEPHNVKPSVVMLIMLAQIERDKRTIDPCLVYVRQALEVLDEEKTQMSSLHDDFLAMIYGPQAQAGDLSAEFLDKRRQFIVKSLHVEKSLQYTMRMVAHLLTENEWPEGGKMTNLAHRRIPNLVREFDTFLPNELHYQLPTGHVSFVNGQNHREYAIQLDDDHFHARVGRVRQLVDTDDYQELVANVKALPKMLARRENWCYWCQSKGHTERDCLSVEAILALKRPFGKMDEEPEMFPSEDDDEDEDLILQRHRSGEF